MSPRIMTVIAALGLLFVSPSQAAAMSQSQVEKKIALMINLNGHLCAKVTSVTPLQLQNTYEVRCIEYGGGSGTVDYVFAIRADGVIVEKR